MRTASLSRGTPGRARLLHEAFKIAQEASMIWHLQRQDEAIVSVRAYEHIHEGVLDHPLELKEARASMIVSNRDQSQTRP